jgi:cyclin-dependent kinase 8/11
VYKAVLLPSTSKTTLPPSTRKALSIPTHSPTERLGNPELCMRPGDLPAKEGDVFAIKKFKPDKEGDVQTYAGISQSGIREIMVGPFGA